MPRVLVLGATGYLGNPVALALVRSGIHTVWGLTRSEASGKALAKNEIIPIVCPDPANDPAPYTNAIKALNINVVIDCTAAYGDSLKFLHAVRAVGEARAASFKSEGVTLGAPKVGYIYVSGAWVHGDSPDAVSDVDPVGTPSAKSKPLGMVAWRPELEREVLAARDVMDVLIYRPAILYGRGSSAWGGLWGGVAQAVKEGKSEVQLPMPAGARVPTIHVEDIADAIAKGVLKLGGLGGNYPVFDIVGHKERLGDVMDAFVRVIAGKGKAPTVLLTAKTAGESGNAFLEAMGATVNITSARARQILGWEAKREGLVDGMELYAKAWEASQ